MFGIDGYFHILIGIPPMLVFLNLLLPIPLHLLQLGTLSEIQVH